MANDFASGGQIPERFWRLNRWWIIWGIVATVLPLLNIYVMVQKVRLSDARDRRSQCLMNTS